MIDKKTIAAITLFTFNISNVYSRPARQADVPANNVYSIWHAINRHNAITKENYIQAGLFIGGSGLGAQFGPKILPPCIQNAFGPDHKHLVNIVSGVVLVASGRVLYNRYKLQNN